MRVAPEVVLSTAQHAELIKLSRSRLTSARLVQRSRIVLLASEGHTNKEIAAKLGIGSLQVARWRARYLASGLAGIERDLPRGAPPRKIDMEKLIELTTQSTAEEATCIVPDDYIDNKRYPLFKARQIIDNLIAQLSDKENTHHANCST